MLEVVIMLIKFTVSNYKNFNKPICLDLTSTHDYRFGKECIKDSVISKAIVYGKNSSGKSNLGYALFDIVNVLTNKNIESMQINPASFLNADSDGKNARFEYVFEKDKKIISFIYEKSAPKTLAYEELKINEELIYSYNFINKEKCFDNLSLINAENLNLEYLDDNLSILRYIASNTNQPEDSLVRFVMDYVSHMLWFRSLQENGYIGYTTGVEDIYTWIVDNNLAKEFSAFLKEVAGVDKELEVLNVEGPVPSKMLIEKHKRSALRFQDVASSGTRSLALFFYWSYRFNDVSFLFLDEFDAFYHFDLAKNIVRYLLKNETIQAIFTTHNSFLASNDLLRPDCYFVLEHGELRSFADSTDRELREGHNLEKMLRSGEFDV